MKQCITFMLFYLLAGCVHLLPGTEPYIPKGKIESSFFSKSNFSVFPNDVKANLDKYKGVTVAWTGIISDTQLEEPADRPQYAWWKVKVSHRYFDWLKDRNLYQIEFYLSSKGEGDFIVMVGAERYTGLNREEKISEVRKALARGNMIWAYGHPDKIEGGVVRLNGGYVNSIDKTYFNAEEMSYGRIVPEGTLSK